MGWQFEEMVVQDEVEVTWVGDLREGKILVGWAEDMVEVG